MARAALARLTGHGDTPRWRRQLDELPHLTAHTTQLNAPTIVVGNTDECTREERDRVVSALRSLCPWRKGPFQIFGTHLDAEWRSDLKWARLQQAATSLGGRSVLDVGSGNGYYCLRALGAGALRVLGIDPSLLFVMQFEALRRLLPPLPVSILPLGFEELVSHPVGFDTVLSMGVLYHRRDPREHLERLYATLRPGGELVLETLVVEGHSREVLVPEGRYANMGNVWSIPALTTLTDWLRNAGFHEIRVASVTPTTTAEQRSTEWMASHSLDRALDPTDPTLTVEGYPAPTRGLLVANKPT